MGQSQPRFPTWQAYLAAAQAARERGDDAGAFGLLSEAMAFWPDAAPLYHHRGHVLFDQDDQRGAIADYTRVLKLAPETADAWGCRGLCYLDLGQAEAALADLNQSLVLHPQVAGTWAIRARAHERLQNYAAALSDWLRAIELAPGRADFHYGAGEAYFQRDCFQQARDCFSRAGQLDPTDSHAFSYRAACHNELADHWTAIADADHALALKPSNGAALFSRARAHKDLGHQQQAFADFSALLAQDNQWSSAYYHRGLLYQEAGWHREAAGDFSAAIALKPELLPAYRERAKAWQALGQAHLAQQDLAFIEGTLRQRIHALSERGRRVKVAVVQAYIKLYSTRADDNAYAIVALTFDPQLQADDTRLSELARRAGALKHSLPADPIESAVGQQLASELGRQYRRLPLPRDWTGGAPAYSADLYIHRPFLPEGKLVIGELLDCIAEAGPQGRIELLPPESFA